MKTLLIVVCGLFLSLQGFADEKSKVHFGGFVDSYYSYDFNSPSARDRAYTTQAVRDSEFNINLAFVEAKIEEERTRGRLALQTGTSVQANYAAEPANGSNSGPLLSRHIQEAYAGYRAADPLWIDAGIFASHIGLESFISRDNWNYTRSLTAEYTPYYSPGVRASYQVTPKLAVQFHIINGWGTISDVNKDKSLGFQASYSLTDFWTLTYNNYYGNDIGERSFHQVLNKFEVTPKWKLAVTLDYGQQKGVTSESVSIWSAATVISQYKLTDSLSLNGRVERFKDSNLAAVSLPSTVTSQDGFDVWGGSVGIDTQLESNLVWRNEIRALKATSDIFSAKSSNTNSDIFAVTSIALTL